MDDGSVSTRGISTGNVSGPGIIIGENIKTGDISINVVYETIKNFGLDLLPSTYFKDNQNTDDNFAKWKNGFRLRLPSIMKGLEYRRNELLKEIRIKLEGSESNHRLLLLGKPGSSKKGRCSFRENKIENALDHLENAICLGEKKFANAAKMDKEFDTIKEHKRFISLVNI